jgi:hypothetical protein
MGERDVEHAMPWDKLMLLHTQYKTANFSKAIANSKR